MSQEIENNVDAFLNTLEVEYKTRYNGCVHDGEWEHDKWVVSFTRGDRTESFDFKTGTGLRHVATSVERTKASYGFQGLTAKDKQGLTMYGRRYLAEVEKLRKVKEPSAASVLNSLLLDSGATTMSFTSWCENFGYDTDSRKAEQTYRACQEESDKLSKIFSGYDLAQLSTLTEDY